MIKEVKLGAYLQNKGYSLLEPRRLKLPQKRWLHIVLWAAMLIYLVTAPGLYSRYIVNEGKPVAFYRELPLPTNQLGFSVDRLDLIKGQGLFALVGWSFPLVESDPTAFTRWIVLESEQDIYLYPSTSIQNPELQTIFKDSGYNVTDAGFSTLISKFAVAPGTYQIGILFEHKTSDVTFYAITDKIIIRTPNQMRMETLRSQPQD